MLMERGQSRFQPDRRLQRPQAQTMLGTQASRYAPALAPAPDGSPGAAG